MVTNAQYEAKCRAFEDALRSISATRIALQDSGALKYDDANPLYRQTVALERAVTRQYDAMSDAFVNALI